MLDKQPGFYLHEQCMLYGDLHERLMPFLTLKTLCKTLLSEYTNDEMIINEYVKQNQMWMEADLMI